MGGGGAKANFENRRKKKQEAEMYRKIRESESTIRRDPFETLIIFDNEGNEFKRISQGAESQVEFNYEDALNRISSHNHPHDSAPSAADVSASWVSNRSRVVSRHWEQELYRNGQNLGYMTDAMRDTYYATQRFATAYQQAIDRIVDTTRREWLNKWAESDMSENKAFGMTSTEYIRERGNYRLRMWLKKNAPQYGYTFSFKRLNGKKYEWESKNE